VSAESPAASVGLKTLIDQSPWRGVQILAFVLICATMIMDGLDQLIMALALPAISHAWKLPPGAFGNVVAIGLAGVGLGTIFGGALGDRLGRKRILIFSVIIFGVFTLVAAASKDMTWLLWARFLSGWGLGGAIPNATTLLSEVTPRRRTSLVITMAAASIPLGGVVGGAVGKQVLPLYGWQTLFLIAGAAPLVIALLLVWLLPESPIYLLRSPKTAGRLAAVLSRLRISAPAGTTIVDDDAHRIWGDVRDLFRGGLARDSFALWAGFIFIMTTGLLLANWIPSILGQNGFPLKFTSQGMLFYTIGGTFGALTIALLIKWLSSRVIVLFGLIAVGASAVLGLSPSIAHMPQNELLGLLTLLGFCNTGILSPMFALAAYIYPVNVRGTGTAIATALGRVGAIGGTYVAAQLIGTLHGTSNIFFIAAGLLLCCALCVLSVRKHIPRAT
jgi:AAHS family 4-hydroxybenzoate transporter-like MFS transporter